MAAKTMARTRLTPQWNQSGPGRLLIGLSIVVNGMWSSATAKDKNNAPDTASAPWAKLTVCVALKMSTKPSATMA